MMNSFDFNLGRTMLGALILALLWASGASAQRADSATTDSIFLRAQRMVAEGKGDAGRALVQAEFVRSPTGSPRYIEALYWRGALAATAADAERDFRRIIVEYPLSRWFEDALLRMAQLEMVRGDRKNAMAHLDRLVAERPTSASRPRASYWIARVMLDDGNVPGACARLKDARERSAPSDVELRNQVDFYSQRCSGIDTIAVAAAPVESVTNRPIDKETVVSPAPPPPPPSPPSTPVPVSRPSASATVSFTVQVAAYNTLKAADALRVKLVRSGFKARVMQAGNLFRVRVGRYATREAALEEAARLKARKIAAFVTEAEAPNIP
jgi:cell division septation protein DedD